MMISIHLCLRKALCVAVPLMIGGSLVGCDAFEGYGAKDDPILPDQTEILEVIVRPDTVAVGDTVTLKVVICDSLDTSFRFEWLLPDSTSGNRTLHGRVVKWVANPTSDVPGEVVPAGGVVTADNGASEAHPVSEVFSIPIRN